MHNIEAVRDSLFEVIVKDQQAPYILTPGLWKGDIKIGNNGLVYDVEIDRTPQVFYGNLTEEQKFKETLARVLPCAELSRFDKIPASFEQAVDPALLKNFAIFNSMIAHPLMVVNLRHPDDLGIATTREMKSGMKKTEAIIQALGFDESTANGLRPAKREKYLRNPAYPILRPAAQTDKRTLSYLSPAPEIGNESPDRIFGIIRSGKDKILLIPNLQEAASALGLKNYALVVSTDGKDDAGGDISFVLPHRGTRYSADKTGDVCCINADGQIAYYVPDISLAENCTAVFAIVPVAKVISLQALSK